MSSGEPKWISWTSAAFATVNLAKHFAPNLLKKCLDSSLPEYSDTTVCIIENNNSNKKKTLKWKEITVGMACQKVHKQGREDIKVKGNMQSPIHPYTFFHNRVNMHMSSFPTWTGPFSPTQEVSWLLEWYMYTLSYNATHRQIWFNLITHN